jgi:hypothetical protein
VNNVSGFNIPGLGFKLTFSTGFDTLISAVMAVSVALTGSIADCWSNVAFVATVAAEWPALPAFLYTSNIRMSHCQGVRFINRTSKFKVVKIFRGD